MSLCKWKLPWSIRLPGPPKLPPDLPIPSLPIFDIGIPGYKIRTPAIPGIPALPPALPIPSLPIFDPGLPGFKPRIPGFPGPPKLPPDIPIPSWPGIVLPPCPLDAAK